jgi:hypothetical protein
MQRPGDAGPAEDGGDARFPDLTFLQLLFGHRTASELQRARADCYRRNVGTRLLLEVLFPKRHCSPAALGFGDCRVTCGNGGTMRGSGPWQGMRTTPGATAGKDPERRSWSTRSIPT